MFGMVANRHCSALLGRHSSTGNGQTGHIPHIQFVLSHESV
jgi:hypothetical protein